MTDDDYDERLSLLSSSAVATSAASDLEFTAGEDYPARWARRAPARGQAGRKDEAEPPPPAPAAPKRTPNAGGGAKSAAAAARWEVMGGGAAFSEMEWTLQA